MFSRCSSISCTVVVIILIQLWHLCVFDSVLTIQLVKRATDKLSKMKQLKIFASASAYRSFIQTCHACSPDTKENKGSQLNKKLYCVTAMIIAPTWQLPHEIKICTRRFNWYNDRQRISKSYTFAKGEQIEDSHVLAIAMKLCVIR